MEKLLLDYIIYILSVIGVTHSVPKYESECTGVQIFYFQNTFDRACDDIRMKSHLSKVFGNVKKSL
jgi:hypothetical protein